MTVNVHHAKTHLSRLLEQASAGKEVVISRYGRPVARIVPFRRSPVPRRLGTLKGRIVITGDFDSPLPNSVLKGFRGGA